MSEKVREALAIIEHLGLPREQRNERSALCLLALCGMTPEKAWKDAENPLRGITPIMDWVREFHGRDYAPNTRETFRRQTMHQFLAAGLVAYNPDDPGRPVNSPKAAYQLTEEALALVRAYGTRQWEEALGGFLEQRGELVRKYARERDMAKIPVVLPEGRELILGPGALNALIRAILEEFAPRFMPGALPVYVGDAGDKRAYLDDALLARCGVTLDEHGRMPDVVLLCPERGWIILVEAVTSHGPISAERHAALADLFGAVRDSAVYVTAFPNRGVMARHLADIAWETEVWTADAPSHLIHFDGERFLGPYGSGGAT